MILFFEMINVVLNSKKIKPATKKYFCYRLYL
jgi:hypothetical protein